MPENPDTPAHRYWRINILLVTILLLVWGIVSLGLATVWADPLDKIRFGGFKLGFWIAHQGGMVVFVILIWIYVWAMNRLDRRFRVDETDM